MAELFAGKPLINQKGETVDGGEVLHGKKVIALYFSAMWCGSCRQFTPKVKRFYEAVKAAGKELEIVLVSRDREAEDLLEYLGHNGDYYAIPFGDERIQEYLKKYEVPTIPAFKLINDKGELLHDGRADVTERGKDEPVAVFDEWAENVYDRDFIILKMNFFVLLLLVALFCVASIESGDAAGAPDVGGLFSGISGLIGGIGGLAGKK
ncbi:unnamed protein product [Caenorhabditis sp. 36 PRJEB53466]|nr:unnamed protein product [Caenorhabditis sp. 36 PRJEB53466]